MRSAPRLPLALDLEQKGDVLVELREAQEAHKLVHDWFLEVDLDTERALNKARVENFHLLLRVKCFVVHLDGEGVFVCIVVKIDEAVVEQESRVALFAVRVVNLLSTLDVLKSLNDESLAIISISPAGLARAFVIQHVCVWNETICLDTFDLDAENTARYHHANLGVLLQGELAIVRNFVANRVVVLLDVSNFFTDLILEGAAF